MHPRDEALKARWEDPIARYAEKLADGCPAQIMGEKRAPALYRYCHKVFTKGDIDRRTMLDLVRWVNDKCLLPSIARGTAVKVMCRAYACHTQ